MCFSVILRDVRNRCLLIRTEAAVDVPSMYWESQAVGACLSLTTHPGQVTTQRQTSMLSWGTSESPEKNMQTLVFSGRRNDIVYDRKYFPAICIHVVHKLKLLSGRLWSGTY